MRYYLNLQLEAPSHITHVQTSCVSGAGYFRLGDAIQQALTLFRQIGSKLGEVNVRKAMGDLLVHQGDYREALVLYETAYKLYQQIQDNYSQARLLAYRSQIYIAMNELSLAIQDVKTALVLAQRFNLPFVGLLQQILDDLNGNE